MSHLNNVKRLSNPAQKKIKKKNKGIFASEHSKNEKLHLNYLEHTASSF